MQKGGLPVQLDYSQIGERISRRRKKMQMTQSELAERVNTSNQYISNIERAVSIPSTEVIMRLARALGTTPDEFLVGTTYHSGDGHWEDVAQNLRVLNRKQLALVEDFILWVKEEEV